MKSRFINCPLESRALDLHYTRPPVAQKPTRSPPHWWLTWNPASTRLWIGRGKVICEISAPSTFRKSSSSSNGKRRVSGKPSRTMFRRLFPARSVSFQVLKTRLGQLVGLRKKFATLALENRRKFREMAIAPVTEFDLRMKKAFVLHLQDLSVLLIWTPYKRSWGINKFLNC